MENNVLPAVIRQQLFFPIAHIKELWGIDASTRMKIKTSPEVFTNLSVTFG